MIDPVPIEILVTRIVEKLFACPGDFLISLEKKGDKIDISAGGPKDFLSYRQVANELNVHPNTIRNRYVKTNKLKRFPRGFRRADVEKLKNEHE